MSPIESLFDRMAKDYPRAVLHLTPPLRPDGIWSLDCSAGVNLAIQWSQETGFGVSEVRADRFGEGPDEVFGSVDAAWRRIRQLLIVEGSSDDRNILVSMLEDLNQRVSCLESDSEGRGASDGLFRQLSRQLKGEPNG